MVYNARYDEDRWKYPMLNVIKRANTTGLDSPLYSPDLHKELCLSYHIKGF